MCGIVGYIGTKGAMPFLLSGLNKLEYRGYDSAGIALFDAENKGIEIVKAKGKIKNLEEKLLSFKSESKIGIGHTRWATHGEPSDINSHPHISDGGRIAVVHNGIIENYLKLKEYLVIKGYKFVSETDTEVIAHLIDFYYKEDIVDAVSLATKHMRGSYALGVVCSDNPDKFVAVRKDSPLVIGIGNGENFIASDIPAILEYTKKVYFLEDNEIAVITKDEVTIFNEDKTQVKREISEINWDVAAAEKCGYDHFMLKEIYEQPKVIKDTINARLDGDNIVMDKIKMSKEYLESVEKIYIVACGTAYHAGVVGKYVIEKLTRKSVEIDVASEFRYRDPIINDKTLVFIISQSGETADTLAALRLAKNNGARTVSIINVVGSSIARESNDVLYTLAGPEIAVASTKAYTSQVSALYLLALDMASKLGTIDKEKRVELLNEIKEIPQKVEQLLKNNDLIKNLAKVFYEQKDIFYLGRGLDYAVALEASLKLKEISYIHSEAYPAGELKHGTIALIEKGTLVIAIATQQDLFEKMLSNIKEVKARGARVLAIVNHGQNEMKEVADMVISIPQNDNMFSSILAVVPLQLFAYHVSILRGCDVDKPRNLAKSVTVE